MPNRRRRKLSTAMSAVAALAVASPIAVVAITQPSPLSADTKPAPQHREFVQASLITDLPSELLSALSQGLSQFGINVPPMPNLLTGSGSYADHAGADDAGHDDSDRAEREHPGSDHHAGPHHHAGHDHHAAHRFEQPGTDESAATESGADQPDRGDAWADHGSDGHRPGAHADLHRRPAGPQRDADLGTHRAGRYLPDPRRSVPGRDAGHR